MADAIAAEHGAAARAVLFYGSCLRSATLDGQMLDFYLIVSDYRAAFRKRWQAVANHMLPPNVFPFTFDGLAAKYAVLSETDLGALTGQGASTVSVWARFAQPARLVWVADDAARVRMVAAVARAAPTLLALAAPMRSPTDMDPLAVWRTGFALTYRAELRAERADRSGSIVDADPDRYRRFAGPALAVAGLDLAVPATRDERQRAVRRWAGLRRRGKLLTAARLVKASATFAGGLDYLAWKINRHAGATIVIRPWQRRVPILGAIWLLPRLLRSGSVR